MFEFRPRPMTSLAILPIARSMARSASVGGSSAAARRVSRLGEPPGPPDCGELARRRHPLPAAELAAQPDRETAGSTLQMLKQSKQERIGMVRLLSIIGM